MLADAKVQVQKCKCSQAGSCTGVPQQAITQGRDAYTELPASTLQLKAAMQALWQHIKLKSHMHATDGPSAACHTSSSLTAMHMNVIHSSLKTNSAASKSQD